MALIELKLFRDGMEAQMARGRLEAEGIGVVLFDAGLSSLGLGAMTPVRLMVDEADEEAARQALDL
jgi:hypothetical protein